MLSVPALAAESGTENLVRSKTYTGQFSDLPEDHTFYKNVAALYEYGLSVGQADGTFGLTAPMTVGQTVIFAGRIRSLYRTGDPEAGPAAFAAAAVSQKDAWRVYAPYLWYLQSEGVLDKALDDCLTQPATRAQMAHVLANLLPEEALPLINDSLVTQGYASRRRITDVTEYTPYYQDILKLYRCGVSIEGAAYEDFVTIGEYIAAPATAADYDSDIRYMLAQGEHTLTVQNPAGFTIPAAQETLNAALLAVKRYCEQGYNNAACTYSPAGTMTVKFSSIAGDKTEEYRAEALSAAIAVHDRLWEQGVITAASTQWETAWAYYQWIAANCVYDDAGDNTSVSHLPYSVFHNGKAVCDGYTGAYNLLLKLEGIDCYALPNATHIWTVAVLDGKTVHIDATWGDQGATAAEEYFAMTPEQSYTLHPWPKENERPD